MGLVAHNTAVELGKLRRRLIAFCYQMLGSPFDAEDAAQDVLERAWRARDSFDPERAAFATWCFRIARNVCIDRLRQAPRRPLPRDLQDPGLEIGSPLVPAVDVPWLMPAPTSWCTTSDVESSAERAQDVRLAVTAMLQKLPPRQRGVLVLRDILDFTAAETGAVLEMSVASVNSALQRARAAVRTGGPRPQPLAPGVVERYARAIERADADELAALVAEDVVFEMPPVPDWTRGRESYRAFNGASVLLARHGMADPHGLRQWTARPFAVPKGSAGDGAAHPAIVRRRRVRSDRARARLPGRPAVRIV